MYILETPYETLFKFESLFGVAHYFKVVTNNKGEVYFNGNRDSISYNMKVYTEEEVISDFIRTRMPELINMARYTLYKITKL